MTSLATAPRSAMILLHRDPVRFTLRLAGFLLVILATILHSRPTATAALATIGPFATVGAIIVAAALADYVGVFRLLVDRLLPRRQVAAAAGLLAVAAATSALINIDVGVVVASSLALVTARRSALSARRLILAVALTTNATSFLLPTSNVTNLLLLRHSALSTATYISQSWLPWLLVTSMTVGLLTIWCARGSVAGSGSDSVIQTQGKPSALLSLNAIIDLIAMFLAATAIQSLLGSGLELHGPFPIRFLDDALLASGVNNLPTAAALAPIGAIGLWAAVLGTSIGANIFINGSVASLIARRMATDESVIFPIWQFSAIGLSLLPFQFAVAATGLWLTNAFH